MSNSKYIINHKPSSSEKHINNFNLQIKNIQIILNEN